MKYMILLFVLLASCKNECCKCECSNIDTNKKTTTEIQTEKKNSIYENFTDNRRVVFSVGRDYDKLKYNLHWYFWIDGDLIEMDVIQGLDIDDLEIEKQKINKEKNKIIPKLVAIKWKN